MVSTNYQAISQEVNSYENCAEKKLKPKSASFTAATLNSYKLLEIREMFFWKVVSFTLQWLPNS